MTDCATRENSQLSGIRWTIERFLLHVRSIDESVPEIKLNSPRVSVDNFKQQFTLTMRIYINETNSQPWIVIELNENCSISTRSSLFRAMITCLIVKKNGERLQIYSKEHVRNYTFRRRNILWTNSYTTLIAHANIKDCNDDLTIECRIEDISDVAIPYFEDCFGDDQLTDITFVFGNKKLKAHKVILAGYSPIFSEMFKRLIDEKKENVVEIKDVDYEIFRRMLQFLYTNKVDYFERVTLDLLYIANKYEIKELKRTCELSIWTNITVDNATEALIFAHRHNHKELMEWIKNYMGKHIWDVIKTPKFKNMEKEHPQLAINIYRTSLGIEEETQQSFPFSITPK